MDDVLAVLARERRALERLLFRLLHARGVLVADDERFLAMAADELEIASQTVRELEAARATMVGACGQPTLRALIDQAVEPYASLLHEHHVALGKLAAEVGAMLESTSELATDRLAELRGEGPGRFRRSRRARAAGDALDEAVVAAGYESLLNVSSSVRLPSLVSFLR